MLKAVWTMHYELVADPLRTRIILLHGDAHNGLERLTALYNGRRILPRRYKAQCAEGAAERANLQAHNDRLVAAMEAAAGHLMGAWREARDPATETLQLPPPAQPRTIEGAAAAPEQSDRPSLANGTALLTLHPAARAMLAVLARHTLSLMTWRQVATLAGLAPQGGHWNAGRKQLRERGLAFEMPDGTVAATPDGVAYAGHPATASVDPAAVLALWCAKLSIPAPEMLRALAGSATPVPRGQLAAQLGKKPHGGHWNAGLKALRDNRLIQETPAGLAAVAELRP